MGLQHAEISYVESWLGRTMWKQRTHGHEHGMHANLQLELMHAIAKASCSDQACDQDI